MTGEAEPYRDFVEHFGEFFARAGHQRIAGRVLGWLLICDPPHQSADDLRRVTRASKASVSITLRLLAAADLVERIGVPGQRRAYYRVRPGAWSTDLRRKVDQITGARRLAEEGLALLADATPERRRRLEEMRELYAFFEREFPGLIERWLASRKT